MMRRFYAILLVILLNFLFLIAYSLSVLKNLPVNFQAVLATADKVQLLDRQGSPLSVTYQNAWNVHDRVALYEIPLLLQQAFIAAEDKRFYQHQGVDWLARFHALFQNIHQLKTVRGASTLSEQVVKMLHPRPRQLWSKWLEGLEAYQLEQQFTKAEILEFYLNQVPYAANRRGIKQAARYYFDRDLDTLSSQEILALAVLVRAPSRLDIYKQSDALKLAIQQLANSLIKHQQLANFKFEEFELVKPQLAIQASHFIRHILLQSKSQLKTIFQLKTTLDGDLQGELQGIVRQRLQALRHRKVANAALLVVDHQTAEILAWVVEATANKNQFIDSVTSFRQPGSALKPFLYALALQKGWTAATVIDDAPLVESVGYGLHAYQNYSRHFYGKVSLRQALGNSLNIPALKALQYVGSDDYLSLLRQLGFTGINQHPIFYGDGLALGNAEVSLFELVQAFTVLANKGEFRPLNLVANDYSPAGQVVFSAEISSLMGNILADAEARQLEFGSGSLLNFPVQTAIKTGTSSDFKDSWTLAYNYRYVVGVWMGNLDNTVTDGITGSTGAALIVRSVFSVLNRHQQTQPLYLSPQLIEQSRCLDNNVTVCTSTGTEYFIDEPQQQSLKAVIVPKIRLRQPTNGLHLAIDPRVSHEKQAFEFIIQAAKSTDRVEWLLNGKTLVSEGCCYLWQLQRGKHQLQVKLWRGRGLLYQSAQIEFLVK